MSVDAQRVALICGISGQDGAYLSSFLLAKGYEVWGTSRDVAHTRFSGLRRLGVFDRVRLRSMSVTDFESVSEVVRLAAPDEIYNLAGQSSVGRSFEQPLETLNSIALGTLNLLEAIRQIDPSIRLFNAGSSEVFGEVDGCVATEAARHQPRSPYGVAKAASAMQVEVYRRSYGLFACTGFLYNHESPLRPEHFVTSKIVSAACRIARGSDETLRLGNLGIERDWGWAPEYVDAMWRMLDHEVAEDFVIATGIRISLLDFVAAVFDELSLDWRNHVQHEESLMRPTDIPCSVGDSGKAARLLGWRAECGGLEVARRLVRAQIGPEQGE